MSITFTVRDVMHKVAAKFVPAFLPGAKEQYYLRAAHQPELDIHDIASKAEVYSIHTDPRVIEEGFTAALKLICYLAADGYRIKTPLFKLKLSIPGVYKGSERELPKDVRPQAHITPSADFADYLAKRVEIEIDDKLDSSGAIGSAIDEATGQADETATIGGLITINGAGLKIKADDEHRGDVGLFFEAASGARVRADMVPVNEPLVLRAVVPEGLTEGEDYTPVVVTQSTMKYGGTLLNEPRVIHADFTIRARR